MTHDTRDTDRAPPPAAEEMETLYLSRSDVAALLVEVRENRRRYLEEEKLYDGYSTRMATAARVEAERIGALLHRVERQVASR